LRVRVSRAATPLAKLRRFLAAAHRDAVILVMPRRS
jgi:hypothetical protein